jgi:hypothetical protein
MKAEELLADLLRSGISLTRIGDQIELEGPKEVITEHLLGEVARRKAEIVALLSSKTGCDDAIHSNQDDIEIDLKSIPECPRCGSLEKWWNALGKARCLWCDPPTTAMNLLARTNEARGRHSTGTDRRRSKPTMAHCRHCLSTEFTDTTIHGGRSVLRVCAQCGLTVGFPMWFGQMDEKLGPNSGYRQ